MGCGPSAPKGPPPPNDAPADWTETVDAVFKLDKPGAGYISTINFKKRDTKFSEITILGDDICKMMLEAGDLPENEKMSSAEWVTTIRGKVEGKGWGPMEAFLKAVLKAAADDSLNDCATLGTAVYKSTATDWCQPATPDSVDMAKECKEMGDQTEIKAESILQGLAADKTITGEEWSTHLAARVNVVGWPRAKKELSSINARLEKVKELDDMGGG